MPPEGQRDAENTQKTAATELRVRLCARVVVNQRGGGEQNRREGQGEEENGDEGVAGDGHRLDPVEQSGQRRSVAEGHVQPGKQHQ